MNDVVKMMFDQSMHREGHTVTTYLTQERFTCFFRKANDNANSKDSMVMYYPVGSPVKAGMLLSYGGYTYLALNQETAENNVYFKSAIIKTNGNINTHSLSVNNLPFYGDGVNNALSAETANISIISGNVEITTEDCAASRALEIDDLFNEWGRTWKITNLFYIDGICHIVLEVNADVEPTYEYRLDLTELAVLNVEPGDTDVITATAFINDTEYSDAVIGYNSSNNEIATIDSNGNISYLAEGEVYFTATWDEHDITQQTEIVTVMAEPASDEVAIYVQAIDEIFFGFPETLTYYATRGGVRDDTIPVTFKAENIAASYAKKITITDNGNHTIDVEASGSTMVGKTFDLVGYNEEYGVEFRQNIKISSMF